MPDSDPASGPQPTGPQPAPTGPTAQTGVAAGGGPGSSPYASPPATPAAAPAYQHGGDATGGVIPYKNPKALTAYYLGIFSLFPAIGLPLGVASIWLGILGLKARRQNPIVRGHVHAWIGIVLGVLGMPLHLLVGVGCVAAILGA